MISTPPVGNHIDYRRMLRIVLAGRYHATSHRIRRHGLSEPNGIRATQRLARAPADRADRLTQCLLPPPLSARARIRRRRVAAGRLESEQQHGGAEHKQHDAQTRLMLIPSERS